MRGKGNRLHAVQSRKGITPAYAGKSTPTAGRFGQCRDHPRMCGEKSAAYLFLLPFRGSPPHVRGKGQDSPRCVVCAGITPACAGKRPDRTETGRRRWDHPRTCGEKLKFIAVAFSMWGSPPHMRGKGNLFTGNRLPPGITPAHAGKSGSHNAGVLYAWDHPRTCGEKYQLGVVKLLSEWITPAHAGKSLHPPPLTRWGGGITPAHAGKRPAPPAWLPLRRDHPRTCGEKCSFGHCLASSSRITPAHAGKSLFASSAVLLP